MPDIYTCTYWLIERDRICAHCGKVFQTHGDEWGYYYRSKIACSYGCMRAMESEEQSGTSGGENRSSGAVPKRRKMNEQDVERIGSMRKAGTTVKEICDSTGFCATSVKAALRSMHITKKTHVITAEQQTAFKALHDGGMSYRAIAMKYDVSASTVRRNVLGKVNDDHIATGGEEHVSGICD